MMTGAAAADYTALYCEENIHRLLSGGAFSDAPAWAVLISNAGRQVAVYSQRAAPEESVVWDYHVVAAYRRGPVVLVHDPDSTLPCPCALSDYAAASFRAEIPRRYRPLFRLLAAREYIACLVSDRSHMRSADGGWLSPPPPWPAPGAGTGRPNTLMDLIDMKKPRPGLVLDLEGLLRPSVWT